MTTQTCKPKAAVEVKAMEETGTVGWKLGMKTRGRVKGLRG